MTLLHNINFPMKFLQSQTEITFPDTIAGRTILSKAIILQRHNAVRSIGKSKPQRKTRHFIWTLVKALQR